MQLTLSVLPNLYAISRLPADAALPDWAQTGEFVSLTRTADELSVVCPQKNVPPDVKREGNWRCLKVAGPLDFALTGVLASLAGALAEADISLFAVSTFDTDYLLVKADKLAQAVAALHGVGFQVERL
jgi:hypothetical protein